MARMPCSGPQRRAAASRSVDRRRRPAARRRQSARVRACARAAARPLRRSRRRRSAPLRSRSASPRGAAVRGGAAASPTISGPMPSPGSSTISPKRVRSFAWPRIGGRAETLAVQASHGFSARCFASKVRISSACCSVSRSRRARSAGNACGRARSRSERRARRRRVATLCCSRSTMSRNPGNASGLVETGGRPHASAGRRAANRS